MFVDSDPCETAAKIEMVPNPVNQTNRDLLGKYRAEKDRCVPAAANRPDAVVFYS
jgi:hypothetical protein